MSPTQELEALLKPRPEVGKDRLGIRSQNRTRDLITVAFPERSCHVLPHPGVPSELLQQLESTPDSELDTQFVQVRVLRAWLAWLKGR